MFSSWAQVHDATVYDPEWRQTLYKLHIVTRLYVDKHMCEVSVCVLTCIWGLSALLCWIKSVYKWVIKAHLLLRDQNAQCSECVSLSGLPGTAASLWGVLVLESGCRPRSLSGHKDLEILLHCSTYSQERPQVSEMSKNAGFYNASLCIAPVVAIFTNLWFWGTLFPHLK